MNDEVVLKSEEINGLLEKNSNREEAVNFLVKETGISKEECATAYDFLVKINLEKK